jgi:dihydroxyacetone kinase
MRVEDEATYAKAFEELMQEQVKNSDVAGAYGLWRVVGGSDQEVTHISFAGAPNIAELLSGSMQPTKAVQKFYSEVGELRSVTRQVMNTVVGDF